MPNINQITEVLYTGDQPYHYQYDNLPLINILKRIDLVNNQVDINTDILLGCAGTVGTLSNRLSVALADDGKLKLEAVDASLHNIGAHSDGEYDGVEYVRMMQDERDKLATIQNSANNLKIEIEDTISSDIIEHIVVENGLLKFRASDSVGFEFDAPDILKIHSIYPPNAAHTHNYNLTPAHQNPGSPDYKNFITTSINTPFKEGSLRVYVNGVRLGDDSVKVLSALSDPTTYSNWKNLYIYSSNYSTGEFVLNDSLTSFDVIMIDFDQNLQ
jgi:hypothetical protein